jgi:phosphohistidine phosphatase
MVKDLFILRHGMAEAGNDNDFERKLTDMGKGRITRLAHLLQTRDLEFEFALYSTAKRCKDTFEILHANEVIMKSLAMPEIYQAGHNTLLQLLSKVNPSHQKVVLVGHNPGVSQLLGYLSGDLSLMLSPGMMVHLRFEGVGWGDLSKSSGSIVEVLQ